MAITAGYLIDLDAALAAAGLAYETVPGWQSRGHGDFAAVSSIVCHHTAGGIDAADLNIVTYGRSDLAGPLANLVLKRDGTPVIVAAGVCWHAGQVVSTVYDNEHAIGIEAVADGVSAWSTVQYEAYAGLCAALCRHYALPASRVVGHKEVNTVDGKIDPNFDMAAFRTKVAGYIANGIPGDDMPFTPDDIRNLAADGVANRMTWGRETFASRFTTVYQMAVQFINGVSRTGAERTVSTSGRNSFVQELADAKTLGLQNRAAIAALDAKLDAVLAAVNTPAQPPATTPAPAPTTPTP